ncbi:hypothetical protein NX059_008284 [Plenodomus lindquistii]|nr:hypothetical protein NX059_008284 [Plenodomus lindquistii]
MESVWGHLAGIAIKDEPKLEAEDEHDSDTKDEPDIEPPGFNPDEEIVDLHILACQSPPPEASPHYSESLTRLQKGFLGVIAHLEARNASLTEDLAISRSLAASATAIPAPAPTPALSPSSATKIGPVPTKISHLEHTLATKNAMLREKNTTIIKLDREVKRIGKDLEIEKRKNAQAAKGAEAINQRLYHEMMVERRARRAAENGRSRENLGVPERKRRRVGEERQEDDAIRRGRRDI